MYLFSVLVIGLFCSCVLPYNLKHITVDTKHQATLSDQDVNHIVSNENFSNFNYSFVLFPLSATLTLCVFVGERAVHTAVIMVTILNDGTGIAGSLQ